MAAAKKDQSPIKILIRETGLEKEEAEQLMSWAQKVCQDAQGDVSKVWKITRRLRRLYAKIRAQFEVQYEADTIADWKSRETAKGMHWLVSKIYILTTIASRYQKSPTKFFYNKEEFWRIACWQKEADERRRLADEARKLEEAEQVKRWFKEETSIAPTEKNMAAYAWYFGFGCADRLVSTWEEDPEKRKLVRANALINFKEEFDHASKNGFLGWYPQADECWLADQYRELEDYFKHKIA